MPGSRPRRPKPAPIGPATSLLLTEAVDWAKFTVTATNRAAIYDERFPARWDRITSEAGGLGLWGFTPDRAIAVLRVFAVHWEHLNLVGDGPARQLIVALDVTGTDQIVGIAFIGVELRTGQVVVTHAELVRRLRR